VLDSVGRGAAVEREHPIGATVLGLIDQRGASERLEDDIVVEEGAFPSAMAAMLRIMVGGIAAYSGTETGHGFRHWFRERLAAERDLFGDPQEGALNRTLMFLMVGHDGADGLIELDRHRQATIKWDLLKRRKVFTVEDRFARAMSARLGGMFVKDPLNTPMFLNNLISVHPLGGCPMGDDSAAGVVDSDGRVFSDDGKVHRGLYVADGSIIPTSLGVNPLWTISSLAERIAETVARDLGFEPRASVRLPAGTHIQP
jgi:cholesterol oxidase